MKTFRALALLAVVIPSMASAQVRGTVRDDAGHAVDGAVVELLSAGARLAITESDTAGAFAFLPAPGAVALVVRRIGFQPARVVLAAAQPSRPLIVVMRRRPVRVAGIAVAAPLGRCDDRDHADARRLWQAAARRYASGALMASLLGEGKQFRGSVPAESQGVFDTTRAAPYHIEGIGFRPIAYNRERFYGMPPAMGVTRSYQWDYPFLESLQAWHFADQLFGDLNAFTLAPRELGDVVIEFCSRHEDRPYVVGHLYLGPDTTLLKAQWRFVTDEPREDAGGEVVFMPPASGAPLLAASGQFWRAKSDGYYQEWTEFTQWYECEGSGGCEGKRPLGR